MNCWPSGKCVHLLYMYSILGRGSFCFNYWLNSAWHGADQFVALLRWCEDQVSLTAAFGSSACFGLLFLIFLLTILHRFSMFRSGEFAGQSSTTTPCSFNQPLVLLAVWAGAKSCWKMKSASLKSWSAEGSMQCSTISWCAVMLVFKKHNGPTPGDDIAPQIITDCGNLTLDFKQLGLWASPPFLQTLGPWFPNEIQNLLSSEKRTLDRWAPVQFFFS